MELFGKFILGLFFWVLLVWFGAWGYSVSWNMVIPTLFGLPAITMIQAWVAVFVASVLTSHGVLPPDKDMDLPPIVQNLIYGYVKVIVTLLFALIVKGFFL